MAAGPARCGFVCPNLQQLKTSCSPLRPPAPQAGTLRVQQYTGAVLDTEERMQDDGGGSPCLQQHCRTVPRSKRAQQRSRVLYDSEDEGEQPSRSHRALPFSKRLAAAEEDDQLGTLQDLHPARLSDQEQLSALLLHSCTLEDAAAYAAGTQPSPPRLPDGSLAEHGAIVLGHMHEAVPMGRSSLDTHSTPSSCYTTPAGSWKGSIAGVLPAVAGGDSISTSPSHPDTCTQNDTLPGTDQLQGQQEQQQGHLNMQQREMQQADASLVIINDDPPEGGCSLRTNIVKQAAATPVVKPAATSLPGSSAQQHSSRGSGNESDTDVAMTFQRSVHKPVTGRRLAALFHDEDVDDVDSKPHDTISAANAQTDFREHVSSLPSCVAPTRLADPEAEPAPIVQRKQAGLMMAAPQQSPITIVSASDKGADAAAATTPTAAGKHIQPMQMTAAGTQRLAAPSPWSCFKPFPKPHACANKAGQGGEGYAGGSGAAAGRQQAGRQVTFVLNESSEDEQQESSEAGGISEEAGDTYAWLHEGMVPIDDDSGSEGDSDGDVWEKGGAGGRNAIKDPVSLQSVISNQATSYSGDGIREKGKATPAAQLASLTRIQLPTRSPAVTPGGGMRTSLVGATWPSASSTSTWHQHVPHVLRTPPHPSAAVAVVGRQSHGTPNARRPLLPAAAQASIVAAPRRRTFRVTAEEKKFTKERASIAKALYDKWNAEVFGNRLPQDLPLIWNPRLTSTAGYVTDNGTKNHLKGGDHRKRLPCGIHLSSKVLTTVGRLRSTLAHEMCHAAQWAIDEEYKPQHGPAFKKWAEKIMEYDEKEREARRRGAALTGPQHISMHATGGVTSHRTAGSDGGYGGRQVMAGVSHAVKLDNIVPRTDGMGVPATSKEEDHSTLPAGIGSSGLGEDEDWPPLDITRLHSYELFTPYVWKCQNERCGKEYTRHRESIDPQRHACSKCGGVIKFLGKFSKDGRILQHPPAVATDPNFVPTYPSFLSPPAEETPKAVRNPYQQFVKSHFKEEKAKHPHGTPAPVIMKALAAQWTAHKQQAAQQQDSSITRGSTRKSARKRATAASPVRTVSFSPAKSPELVAISDSEEQPDADVASVTAKLKKTLLGDQMPAMSPSRISGDTTPKRRSKVPRAIKTTIRSPSAGASSAQTTAQPVVLTPAAPAAAPSPSPQQGRGAYPSAQLNAQPEPHLEAGDLTHGSSPSSAGSISAARGDQEQLAKQRAAEVLDTMCRLVMDLRTPSPSDSDDDSL